MACGGQDEKSNKETGRLDPLSCKGFQRLMELKYMRCASPALNPTQAAFLKGCPPVVPTTVVGSECRRT